MPQRALPTAVLLIALLPLLALGRLTAQSPEAISTESLTLEEIFVSTLQTERGAA